MPSVAAAARLCCVEGAGDFEGGKVEYFVYCRDKPGTLDLRWQLVEAHWSFMDVYAEGMVARGPTLAEDGETPTGSVHVVDLPDAEAARVFAYEEPNQKAGVYAEVMVRHWRNALGRRMWSFKGDPDANPCFLVIAHGRPGASAAADGLAEAHREFLADQDRQNRLIVGGPLLSDDGSQWVGIGLMVELPSRPAVEAMLADDPCAKAGLYERVEIHRWRFGGRPDCIHVR